MLEGVGLLYRAHVVISYRSLLMREHLTKSSPPADYNNLPGSNSENIIERGSNQFRLQVCEMPNTFSCKLLQSGFPTSIMID